jgi:Cu/Ag efflux pump CusA
LLGLLPAAVTTGIGNEIGHRLAAYALEAVRVLVE